MIKFLKPIILSLVCVSVVPMFASQGNAGSMPVNQALSFANRLITAAWVGNADTVKLLLSLGADPNVASSDGWTPLMLASRGGHEAIARLLLDAGAQVDAVDAEGWRALMVAAQNSREAVARLLLRAGARVNAAKKNGWTALMSASKTGHEAVVRMLLDAGAQVNAVLNANVGENNNGVTALMLAAQNGHEVIVRVLLDARAQVNDIRANGWTALMMATQSGHETIVRVLLDAGAQVNGIRANGWTALMTAAQNGHEAIMRLLLRAGARVNAANNDGWTVLMFASGEGNLEVVRILLAAGADPNAAARNGATALRSALREGHAKIVALLSAASNNYGEQRVQQPAQSLVEAVREYCRRKLLFDEIELQCKAALEYRNQRADTGIRDRLTNFTEQSGQRLAQAESALKACESCILEFISCDGSLLTEAEATLLLESDSFENFHVKLLAAEWRLQSVGSNSGRDVNDRQLLERYKIFERLFGPDISLCICKEGLLRPDFRQLRALLAQQA